MAQTLLIGLGGTGSRVVNNVVKDLNKRNMKINDGQICCAVLDTNHSDNESIQDSGTGVPIIATSKDRKIRDYINMYNNLNMLTWCPSSPSFLEESMIDGASELRVKSRIAFMDTVISRDYDGLENIIDTIMNVKENTKVRIMLVSSLAGGTGAGMYIQVALWLRKYFTERNTEVTIRGIFLLPDVFVSTIDDVKNNATTKTRHYANAYASIRELNTINKIKLGKIMGFTEHIAIDDLFDSIRDRNSGKAVFDFAFFIDAIDSKGARFDSIAKYEKMVAQLVYMQMYAPMKTDLISEEDNTFLSFQASDEPLYGSCGTAKAVYPVEDVVNYCALRATQDSLTGGWKKIDHEIEILKREEEQRERDGIYTNEKIDARSQYIKLFEEKCAKKGAAIGKDRLFVSIAKDVKNETPKKATDGKVRTEETDKVTDFIKIINSQLIDTTVTSKSGTAAFEIDEASFVKETHSKKKLASRVEEDAAGIAELLRKFDAKVEVYSDSIISSVFPYSMGDVNAQNDCSVYGLLSKKNGNGVNEFIHPIAMRYVLYKLVSELESAKRNIDLDASRKDAETGGDTAGLFDNTGTKKTETTPYEYLESRKLTQRESVFLDNFESKYAQFINTQLGLCEKYEKEALQLAVYTDLIERTSKLIEKLEVFFKNLDDVEMKVKEELDKNVEANEDTGSKILYVYSDAKYKEKIYSDLDFSLEKSNVLLNKSIIDAVYGKLCYEARPNTEENKAYEHLGVVDTFIVEAVKTYKSMVLDNKENKNKVDLDIYTALCRESDAEHEEARQKDKKDENKSVSDVLSVDILTGEKKVDNTAAARHRSVIDSCKAKLLRMAAPFLIYDREIPRGESGTVDTREKTFWGMHPDVAKACPELGGILGVNIDIQQDVMYPRNELYCYSAVYGLAAVYIPKFNEMKDGMYYKSYRSIIDDMVEASQGQQGEAAFVQSPHLDKTWHKILPYVTPEMQRQENIAFYHGLWLALAYGKVALNQHGHFQVNRAIDTGFGSYTYDFVELLYKDKPITKTDISKLIEVLKADIVFTGKDIAEVEAKFKEELEEMATYIGTEALKGLTTKNEDLNPINMIIRYNEGLRPDKYVTAGLVGALEEIAKELAERYNLDRTEKQVTEAKYRICKRIYDSSKRVKGKFGIFKAWEDNFAKFKIKDETSSEE